MIPQMLSEKVEGLVDHLRAHRDDNISLTDVASVTEVLIATMQAYFRGIDTTIYRECRDLSEYISNARSEIALITPQEQDSSSRIPRAGLELDAIVQATETATNDIMTAAEAIMAADQSDPEAFNTTVNDSVMAIFEACSFQDITGQRISKVVETLTYLETRILQLKDLMGISDEVVAEAQDQEDEGRDQLLSGPALAGEGIDQAQVDALIEFDSIPDAPVAEPAAAAAAAPAPEPEPEPAPVAAKPTPAPAAKPKPAATLKAKPKAAPAKAPEAQSQDDIDAIMNAGTDEAASQDDIDAIMGADGGEDEPEQAADSAAADADDDDGGNEDGGRETTQEEIDALFG